MIILQPLSEIYDNPFQVRQRYDPEAIRDLADSITTMRESRPETRGLIQVPPARLHPTNPSLVQLAAGHSRLRAFRLLASAGDGAGDLDAWGQMPVDLVKLDDRAMADVIWHENAKRRDLSAIEEACALRRAIDQFGYTQAAIGERWGLSQSAVANKLRLLDLPEDAQDAIRSGVLTERHGRALLSAQGKSLELYRRLAAEVLPMAEPAPDIVEKARKLVKPGMSRAPLPRDGAGCAACRLPVERNVLGNAPARYDHTTSRWIYLCESCYRAATGWAPPKATEAEYNLGELASIIGKRMIEAVWPVDLAVGQGEPGVRSALCAGCPALDRRESGRDLCLDADCYTAKGSIWTAHMVAQLEAALAGDGHPVRVKADPSYSSSDLSAYYPSHKAIAAARQCRACEHSVLHYVRVKQGDHALRPVEDLPWVWSCSSARSLSACADKAARALKTADVLEAEKAAAAAQKRRASQGHALAEAAATQIARALAEGNVETWRGLAAAAANDVATNDAIKKLKTTQEIQHYLGGYLVKRSTYETWVDSDSVRRYAEGLDRLGSRLGVSLLSPARRIAGHLDRLERWIDKQSAAHEPKPIEANLHNLDEYLREATLAAGKQELDRGEYDELAERIADLTARLQAISREMITPLVERAELLEAA